MTEDFSGDITYTFGKNVPKQSRPIRWNEAKQEFEFYGEDGVDYDSTKYIGEW